MSIEVMVIRIPGFTKNVALNDGATVGDALSAAGVSIGESETVKIGGLDANAGTVVRNGDRVVIAKGAKGNA